MYRVRDNSRETTTPWNVLETHSVSGETQNRSGIHLVRQTDIMKDVVTLNFKARSKNGEFIVNPMIKQTHKVDHNSGAVVFIEGRVPNSPVVRYQETGTVDPTRHRASSYDPMKDSAILALVDSLEGEAITAAYAGVNNASWESLTDLVELKETLSFLYNPVSSMVKLTLRAAAWLKYAEGVYARWQKRLRRWEKLPPHKRIGRNHNPPELPKLRPIFIGRYKVTDIPSFWLAMRYGLMPLMYSFQDIHQTFLEKANELVTKPTRSTSRKTSWKEKDLSSPPGEPSIGNYGGGSYSYVYFDKGKCRVSARAGVTYIPDLSITAQTGWELNRIPAALWEGVPLSFVADWFQNGSECYDALTAQFRALRILGSWCTTTIEFEMSSGLSMQPVLHTVTSSNVINVVASGKWKRRRHATLSDIQFRLKLDLNGKRIADGLALIYTFLSTGKLKRS